MGKQTVEVFFSLLRAGLWEQGVCLPSSEQIDYSAILELAEEQSVVGLIAAGLEHVENRNIAKKDVLKFIGQALQTEKKNTAMNEYIAVLVDKLQKEGIYTILLKGQGVAHCYERFLWRSCGDIDFFLADDDYERAKAILTPLATSVEKEYVREKHLGMTIDSWVVELHGRLYCGLSSGIEKVLDDIYQDTFYRGAVRTWDDNNVQVCLLSAENDVFYVFTHILQHFYKGGVGLRQICDWCRLLWTYRESLDIEKVSSRIHSAKLLAEWKAFAAFAVDYLGMPAEALPFYSPDKKWSKKAKRICSFILEVGSFGHNRDFSYFNKYPYIIRKVFSFGRRTGDLFRHALIFPIGSIRFFPRILINGLHSASLGE